MTQIELAEALNISSNYLSQVERGCKSFSLDKLLELAAVLEIDEKEFLDFSKLPIFV
ncbi:MAG: helix-turn-helix transcriptional regulator [Selenomonadaceae bacterium]|nr:helix-turn-helix transcriptional regulator [Selenomonadaceae bacterium]